jgi:hypothetical protein
MCLRESGLSVNRAKIEMCIFHKREIKWVTITVNGNDVVTKKEMNILGVQFDTRLSSDLQVSGAIQKANKALNAIKLIRKFFNTNELLKSNYFSILYYNCEVWLLGSLKAKRPNSSLITIFKCNKNDFSAFLYPKILLSFKTFHKKAKRATPKQFSKYKLATILYKIYNQCIPHDKWIHLPFNQYFTLIQNSS